MTTEKVRSDYEKLRDDTFDYYNRTYRTWLDSWNSWSRTSQNMAGAPFRMDVESWFRPYREYMQEWGRVWGSYSNMLANILMPPFSPSRTLSDMTTRWANAYIRIYDSWFRSMTDVIREGWELNRKISAGEEINVERYVASLRNTYNQLSNTVGEIYKDTPFAGITEINKAINQSLETFPEQQKLFTDFVQELFNFNVKLRDISELTLKKANEITSNLGQSTISGDGYDKIVNDFRDTLHRTYENLRFRTSIQPESKQLNQDTTNWVRASVELYVSWLELNLRLTQGMSNSYSELTRATSGLMGEQRTASTEEYSQRWTDTYWKAIDAMVKSSRYFETVPKMITAYSDWLTTGNRLYQTLITPPFSTKEEMYDVWKEVERIRKTVEHKPAAATSSRSKVLEQKVSTSARRGSRPRI